MKCKIVSCLNESKAHGLCSMHYQRKKRYGDENIEPKVQVGSYKTPCTVSGCDKLAKKRGWCLLHYNRWRRTGTPDSGKPDRLPSFSQNTCKVDGCSNNAIALHLCHKHYSKFKKFGDPLAGTVQDGRSKEWHVRDIGYVVRFDRNSPHANKVSGIVLQHRQVMGEAIGRPLLPNENVHHKNGDRADNRLDNLELWVKSQPAGQRVQDKVSWARDILQQYGDLVDKLL